MNDRSGARGRFAHGAVAACLAAAAALPALAQEPHGATAAEVRPCIEVEVEGERVPAYDCLQRRLQPAPARPGAAQAPLASEAIVQRPGNQIGVFNRAATQTRMGNTFGHSVLPQRPAAEGGTTPLLPGAR